jgi:hypothetical protein|nr:MAG TPA: hypothetical protein [Caudoviricetes sp.]
MPDFTLYNASDFHAYTPEDAREEFTSSLGAPSAVSGRTGEARYYSREHIFAACLDVAHGKGEAARLAFGSPYTSPRLVFAQLTPTDVCLLGNAEFPRSLSYRLNAGGEALGFVSHTAPYDHLTTHTLLDASVTIFDFVGSYRVAEYCYVSAGTAYLPNGEEYYTPLEDGSYVLLEQTGTRH